MEEPESLAKVGGEGGLLSWEAIYEKYPLDTLPWYIRRLDPDLGTALSDREISHGRFLDIGTGPGTQATELTKLGFNVTATDLAESALQKAKLRAGAFAGKIHWLVDDIIATKISDPFDYIFDRGCFHTLEAKDRQAYVKNIKKILVPGGLFFLKCFSDEEIADDGPSRFSPFDIENTFGKEFRIEKVRRTYFQGTKTYKPRALFCELSR